ncbi:hypothetical protein HMPREF9689_02926 [Klebsiella oxytoca 10-5245]|nr:hypothetical protein HMPREF9689_02926 [Klebsiella oxytoca 10-5245]SAQ65609.1 Uncharacterised protein [Klebsiella oxytoca]
MIKPLSKKHSFSPCLWSYSINLLYMSFFHH